MPQDAQVVLKALKNGDFAPIYFLQGDEPYYIDAISDFIEHNALPEQERGFNQVIMYGKGTNLSQVLGNARRFPMMAERQVVIVKEAQELDDINKKEGLELLSAYLKNPLPSTILVFCHKYKSVDGRKAAGKLINEKAVLVTTKKLWDNQLPDWVSAYVKSLGCDIQHKAVHMLVDYIGNNLDRLTGEIDKLLLNFKDKVTIDEQMVQKFVGISKEYNVFELQKALAQRDVLKANKIINYFEANPKNNPIIPIIALVFSFYSKVLVVHASKDKSENGLASVLKVKPFAAREYLAASRQYPAQKVMQNIHFLRQADLHSKGVGAAAMPQGELMKELVFKLLH